MAMNGFGAFAEQVAVDNAVGGADPGRSRFRPGGRLHPELQHGVVHHDPADHGRRGGVGPRARGRRGIGLAAVDVGVALGARVIAPASSAPKLEAAMAMGATASIAYEVEDLKSTARASPRAGWTWSSTR